MELVNIVYKYINRFINSEELISELESLDKSKFSESEIKEFDKLLEDVKMTINNTLVIEDETELKRKEQIEHFLEIFKNTLSKDNIDDKSREFLQKRYDNLKKDKERIRDSGPRYKELFDLLTKNKLHNDLIERMSNIDLLEMITEYISAPILLDLTQEEFNDLVDAGIKEDKRESLWRLAVNYENRNKDFTLIEDYFINIKDAYYLIELVSVVGKKLDIKKIIDKVIATKDKEFILDCKNRAIELHLLSDKELNYAKEKISNEL